jgi:hypothetical protein
MDGKGPEIYRCSQTLVFTDDIYEYADIYTMFLYNAHMQYNQVR